jgi:pantetheine-phosphate adenylyltransferase
MLERSRLPPGACRRVYSRPVTSSVRIAVYPGSFDPITLGHLDIIERASGLFDQVIVGLGQHPTKRGYFSVDERCALIEASTEHLKNVTVQRFTGLVVEFCRRQGATVIVRGLRAIGDFEGEFQMAMANRDLAPGVETVLLVPSPDRMFVSSSLVREIASHGGDFARYVTAPVAAAVKARIHPGSP